MRKYVTPAEGSADIPDPARNRDLPSGGAVVEFSAYWAARALRGEVTVRDVLPGDGDGPDPGSLAPTPPFLLTDVVTLQRGSGVLAIPVSDFLAYLATLIGGGVVTPAPDGGGLDLSQPLGVDLIPVT